jgi:hypothetical protein
MGHGGTPGCSRDDSQDPAAAASGAFGAHLAKPADPAQIGSAGRDLGE